MDNLNTNLTITYGLGLFYGLLKVISLYFVMEENNEDGWRVFIPIYGQYVVMKKFLSVPAFVVYFISVIVFFVSCIGVLLSSVMQIYYFVMIFSLIILISILFIIGISIALDVAMSHYHGKKGLFTFGMIFLTPFFLFALAWENRRNLR